MKVFKTCFKVIFKNRFSMLIYFFVFLFFAVVLSSSSEKTGTAVFTASRSRVAFYSEDGDTPLVQGLKDSLSENADFISIPDTLQKRQDALFYHDVDYIVRIPKGFTEGFLSGGSAQIERTAAAGSVNGTYMDFLVNRYLRLAAISAKVPGITQAQIVSDVKASLAQQAEVEVHTFGGAAGTKRQTYYFSYLAYILMAIVILGVTSIMIVFNQPDLRRRNLCSPLNLLSMNLQLVLGNLCFALLAAAGIFGIGFLIYGKAMMEWNTLFLAANTFVYTLVCLSMAFLFGNLIKSRGAQSAVANVVSLGTCFISGVFVPQEYLGKTVLTVASFTPTYWYVKVINMLNGLVKPDSKDLDSIAVSLLIQFGFAVAFLAVSLVVSKQKRTTENTTYEELD